MTRTLFTVAAAMTLLASACGAAPEQSASGETSDEGSGSEAPGSIEQAAGCSNWTTTIFAIGCCGSRSVRYQPYICVYGSWYPNGSSYCSSGTCFN
jgi:hypothetical protein